MKVYKDLDGDIYYQHPHNPELAIGFPGRDVQAWIIEEVKSHPEVFSPNRIDDPRLRLVEVGEV